MATTYKTLTNNDITTTRTLLHEAIPITGSIVSGTYIDREAGVGPHNETNIKNYSHGMFQSVYDYPYLSSSANHIFDITCGYAPRTTLSASGRTFSQHSKKINVYNQMAQVLMGYDSTGTVLKFDRDGDITGGGSKLEGVFFLNFSRLLTKDEIKKDSFRIKLATGSTMQDEIGGAIQRSHYTPGAAAGTDCLLTIGDYNAQTSYKVNSPTGEYGILYTGSTTPWSESGVGLIFYQAGIAVITSSVLTSHPAHSGSSPGQSLAADLGDGGGRFVRFCDFGTGDYNTDGAVSGTATNRANGVEGHLTGSTIQANADGFRNRLVDISFNNTTELNSTIYFCRINHNDFNYSANPTYLDSSKIRVKGGNPQAEPVSYITTVGLYSSDNELLAVAKLSEPLKKTPSTELTLRVRLDY